MWFRYYFFYNLTFLSSLSRFNIFFSMFFSLLLYLIFFFFHYYLFLNWNIHGNRVLVHLSCLQVFVVNIAIAVKLKKRKNLKNSFSIKSLNDDGYVILNKTQKHEIDASILIGYLQWAISHSFFYSFDHFESIEIHLNKTHRKMFTMMSIRTSVTIQN